MSDIQQHSLLSEQRFKKSGRAYFIYYIASQAVFDRGIFILFLLAKGFSNEQIGLLQSVLFIAAFAFEIPTGLLGDKYGRKKSVIMGLLVYIGYCFGVISFAGMTAFILFYAAYGIAMSLVSGSDRALIYDLYKDLGRESEFLKLESLSRSIGSVVLGLAIILGGVLQTISWDAVYLAYAASLIISLAAILLIPETKFVNEHHDEDFSVMRDATKYFVAGEGRLQLPIIIFMALINFVYTPYFIFSQSAFMEEGLSVETVSWIFATAQFVCSAGYITSDKIPQKHHINVAFFICPLLISLLFLFASMGSVYVSVGAFFLISYVVTVIDPIYITHLNEKFDSHIRAFSNSFDGFIQTIFTSLGFYAYSVLVDKVGFDGVITYSFSIPLLSLVFSATYFRKSHQKELQKKTF
ncbi:MFS transporter [Vibrio sp. OCN044]|uniref:MFS transporter n=1 Tax=Vibrio tetraodonis subsp. pristinus TaxID=2695891 RepID=A0A6L8LXM9_9VIBR|nr:MFS transporter [Vibrio tetraodonis]MYM60884.1 MFS transporter [Vibrio tetraodonis subsp. pristinus]